MTAVSASLERLRSQRPEWEPWLALVRQVLDDTSSPEWDAAVPAEHAPRQGAPLLAGATISLERRTVRRLLERLVRLASSRGTPALASVAAIGPEDDACALFTAALCQRTEAVRAAALGRGADPEALQSVLALLPLPLLQACHRRWTEAIDRAWRQGYCPVCAAWPAFAEVRGIERSRYLRCGRCGAAWAAHALTCVFCGTHDHDDLVALVPAGEGARASIEACTRCAGYLKSFTVLQGCAPGAVVLEDLATVDLDLAALERGYARPAGAGYGLDVAVVERESRGFLGWRR